MNKIKKKKLRLKQFREKLGLTRHQVRNSTGIAEITLSNAESGRTTPSTVNIIKLARFYQKSLKQMFDALGMDVSGVPDD